MTSPAGEATPNRWKENQDEDNKFYAKKLIELEEANRKLDKVDALVEAVRRVLIEFKKYEYDGKPQAYAYSELVKALAALESSHG
jgi:hypothetical protein